MGQFRASSINRYSSIVLIGVGVLFLGIAGAMFAFSSAAARSALMVTIVVFLLVGLGLLLMGIRFRRSAAEADRIAQTGLPGQATITGVTQTGVYINEQPQIGMDLNVEVAGRAPYQVRHKEVVPLILLARVQPGSVLPVRVDPADPSRVVILWDAPAPAVPGAGWQGFAPAGFSGGGPWQGSMPMPAGAVADPDSAELEAVRTGGADGTATVLEATDMQAPMGDKKMMRLSLSVSPAGAAPYQAMHVSLVPQLAAARLRPGASLPIKVSPTNPNLFTIEWERF